jgi:hypothetical protein
MYESLTVLCRELHFNSCEKARPKVPWEHELYQNQIARRRGKQNRKYVSVQHRAMTSSVLDIVCSEIRKEYIYIYIYSEYFLTTDVMYQWMKATKYYPQNEVTLIRQTKKNNLRGLSPRANNTDRATASCRRS